MQALQIHSILAASDLLEGSDAVVESAAALAARMGAERHLVHAVEFPGVSYSAMSISAEYPRRLDDARQAPHEQVPGLRPEGARPASEKVCVEGAPNADPAPPYRST